MITVVFAVCMATLLLPGILTTPWLLVPGNGGDAGKNIFAYLYHVLYGKGAWFTGMNYPYGEHIIFTDAQPLLSVGLGYVGHVSIHQALTVMWWSILLSFVLAIVFVYKTLVHFGVKHFMAMLFSGLIILMSPQLFRSLGHFGLSQVCVIPMLFYWTIKYNTEPHYKYAVYIFVLGVISTFLHPYFSAVALVWVALYSLGYFLFTKAAVLPRVKHVVPLFAGVVSVFAITGIVMKMTDPVNDRPVTPYGLTAYCTRGEHIFTSHRSPFWRYLEEHTATVKDTSGSEGFTYLGVVAIIAFLFSLVVYIINLKKKPVAPAGNSVHDFRIWLLAAFAALLFAMGVPFVWHMEWIITYLSFLRQFRTLGRFSWIFYYIITIYSVVVVYRYHARYLLQDRRVAAWVLIAGALATWAFEASGYVRFQREALANAKTNYAHMLGGEGHDWRQFLAANHRRADEFQATLLLRFFHVGSDKLWLGRDVSQIELEANLEVGIQLHMPMVDAMMARSSWSITQKQVKIAGGPFVAKPMLRELPGNKPFLLLNADFDELDPDQKYLLSASDYIGKLNQWRVYACYPDRILANDKKNTDSMAAIAATLRPGDTCIGSTAKWFVKHYDQEKAGERFFGTGAMPQIMVHDTVITEFPVDNRPVEQPYEFSCWFLLGDQNYRSPYFKLYFLDNAGNEMSNQDVLTKESTDNRGLWFRAALYFSIPPNCSTIRCKLCNDPDNAYRIMDELLLRPVDALIISKSVDGKVLVNNHLLQP